MTEATLWVGGRVHTGRRLAEALLVEGDRVAAVGTEDEVRRAAPTGADRHELGGRLVVPGLADAHLHLGELARARDGLDVSRARSIPELGRQISGWAEAHPRSAVVGRGLDLERLAERRWPTVGELDAGGRDRPVVVYHASGHAAVANSAALETAYGPGRAGKAGASAPAHVVEEQLEALRPIVREALPLSPETLEAVAQALVRVGLTAVGTMNTGPEELAALETLDDAGRLPLRVRAYPPLARASEVTPHDDRPGPGRLAVVGVKGFLDGAFGPRTASLEEPYADEPTTSGVGRGDDRGLSEALEAATSRGLVPALHAIGDKAVGQAVRLLSRLPPGARPPRIEHASLTPPPLLEPLRRLGATLVVQPGFVLSDVWLPERLGRERVRWTYLFRTLADLGVPLAGSSDAPFDPPDPWRGIRAAVVRHDELGRSANPSPDQTLTEPEALSLYTTGAHGALGKDRGGELEVGAEADLVVLSVRRLGEAVRTGGSSVEETWLAGRRVFRQASPPGSGS